MESKTMVNELISKYNYSRHSIAKEIKVNVSTVSRIASGSIKEPHTVTRIKLAKLYLNTKFGKNNVSRETFSEG